jgi:TPR repeat protein
VLKNDYIYNDNEQDHADDKAPAGEIDLNGVKIKENYQKALELYYESAEKGNAYSQLQLGRMFLLGVGVDRDYEAALEWIQKSAGQGNGEAQAYLGQMYEKGLGVDRDIRKALELYKKSTEQGNALGQASLAGLYLAGSGVEQNLRAALAWYQKSAQQGNDEALANLGHMYEKGLAVNRDIHQAAELYKKSAEQDNALGQLRLGDFYLNGLAVEQNPRKAFSWYQKSAVQDKDPEIAAQAQQRLGAMYCQGNGVGKDLKKGFEFYEKSAKLGNVEAQLCLGGMYEDGVGVERDHKKALEWFHKSASKSKTPSNRAMGDIYRDGLIVEKNIPEAIKWYKKAAEEGDPYSKSELLKLQLEENAQKKAKSNSAPASKGDSRAVAEAANRQPAGMGVEKNKEKVRAGLDKTGENVILPARGKLRQAQQPKRAKLQIENKIPEIKGPRSIPKKISQAKKAHTPGKWFYLFSAVGIIVLSLAVIWIGFRKKSAETLESLKLRVAENTPLPRPDPGFIPSMIPEPPGKILKIINADRSSRQKGGPPPSPVIEAGPAPVKAGPIGPMLRREYKSLDEGEIDKMLAAKNIFDAERNPGGNFRHRYEIKNVGGLRLIFDRATHLAWTRQQSLVKMNLKKSIEWIASLNHIEYGGSKNWRLPTVEEAAALLKKNTDGEKIFLDAVFGEDIKVIWTGDGFSDSESWVIDFQNGTADHAKNKSRLATLMVSSTPD